jgi:aspartate aminotransferase
MIINSPSNPTGSVWDKSIQLKLIDVAHKHGLVILSDECYESLVYDKSFISTEKLNNKGVTILTIQSLSKTYAMTGWRIGYTAGDPKIVKAMGKIQGQATSCPNSIGQKAAIEALTGDQKKVSEMQEIFRKRRIIMIEKLNKIPHITCPIPGGAFYAFPNVEHYLNKSFNGKKMSTSFDLCDYILDYAKTVSVAGSGFGMDGHIRLSYATNEETFLEGLNKIEKSLSQLN